jgi:adenosylhomocysteine nucleosidase
MSHIQFINQYAPKIFFGTIITGDVFLADHEKNKILRQTMHADAIEMEGASVAQVCYQQKVKFLIIRSLSDDADDKATLDFVQYGKMAAENSAQLVMEILRLMKKE